MTKIAIAAACVALEVGVIAARADDASIRMNTLGFLPDRPKQASIAAAAATEFTVVRTSDGAVAASGKLGEPRLNPDTHEQIAVANFSSLREPGTYRLEVAGVGRSPQFRVAPDVYNLPYATVVRGMYLWRCGTAVSATYGGNTFSHAACHTDDAWLDQAGGGHVRKESTKGWHDAGDYNKYVVNAGFTVGVMFQAYEHFGPRVRDVRLDLPESGNGTPDLLNEIRWELDWLLTMQTDDGRVYHKVSTLKFGGFVKPEDERTPRFFAPWSSAATADFVATTAMAARDFAPFDRPYADRCLAAAKKSYAFLQAHPEDHQADQHAFSTGGYGTKDASRRLWAAAELWETTGDDAYLKDFEARATALPHKVDVAAGWGNVTNLGMYTYVLSQRPGRDAALVEQIKKDLIAVAEGIVKTRDAHGYARPLGTVYFWGANGDVAQQTQTLQVANVLAPNPAYVNTALDAIGHLFGRNVYGRSFVTGLGARPPMHPHDRRSGSDDVIDPWPGYLVGGGWPKATDWHDEQKSYQTNEIAINWNAALIYALAGFVEPTAK